jgi:sugar fermentation stimulation protein A
MSAFSWLPGPGEDGRRAFAERSSGMTYMNIRRAVFLDRPNRFIATIEIDGRQEICHVKNTGRCMELLLQGSEILVQDLRRSNSCLAERDSNTSKTRRTQFDLISVWKGQRLVNIDSSAPNKVFAEWVHTSGLFRDITLIRPEYRFGGSRFDFYIEANGQRCLVEVKGVTLEEDGVARFPDAPTERGVRHLRELISAVEAGYDAYAVFVIQMKGVRYLEPNWGTHRAFGEALRDAKAAGVNILAVDCDVTVDSIVASEHIEIQIDPLRPDK